jgi:hypothetical protein
LLVPFFTVPVTVAAQAAKPEEKPNTRITASSLPKGNT